MCIRDRYIGCFRSFYLGFTTKSYIEKEPNNKSIDKDHKRYCKECNLIKADDTHHCRMCQRCVDNMDHHCFFFAQCIGKQNYRFFLSYALYACILSIHSTLFCHFKVRLLIADLVFLLHISGIFGRLFFLYLLGLVFILFTGSLFLSHLYYILNGSTQLEVKYNKKSKRYGLKGFLALVLRLRCKQETEDFLKNWKKITGESSFLSIFWPSAQIES
eukprot:TRINITY_DN12369_c0_g2_i11.p1 TRINITY_DN12369_c0_g2~~TRINITY_DN12369_c0_g2_i11.p1  ORF type:complete len:216 (+),score=14.96 TRINITY_DN12369_c0_g2_i11:65-712(+)